MSTIRQLAKLSGYSIGTVSLALRDDPRLRQATKDAIRALADLYHYRPNRLMEGAITGKTNTLGCIVPWVSSPYFSYVLQGVLEKSFEETYHVITLQTHHNISHTIKGLQTLVEQRVDGILLASGHTESIPTESLLELKSHGVALVGMDFNDTEIPIDEVLTDEPQLAEQVIAYLVGLGHRQIGVFGHHISPQHAHGRLHAFEKALRAHGLDTQYCVRLVKELDVYDDIWLPRAGRTARPTAIVTMTDELAAQLIQRATRHAIRIPHDLSVVGCGNFSFGRTSLPSLTTVEQYPVEIGRQGIGLLLECIRAEAEGTTFPPRSLMVKPSLIIRESCCPPRKR
ncbi:MAG TPA: LacI family DNA-binding transcriptional regulator [Armatimonadota bacterium]|jgi:LacI family transcriptional regulator